MTEKFTCPRRAAEGHATDNSPLRYDGSNLDEWREDRTCSYDGSMHPDDFMQAVRDRAIQIGPTDKSYKFYLDEPLTDEQQAARRQERIDSYVSRGVSVEVATEAVEKDPLPYSGKRFGKFYTHHLSPEQSEEFVRLRLQNRILWGYPGYAYVPLYLPGMTQERANQIKKELGL